MDLSVPKSRAQVAGGLIKELTTLAHGHPAVFTKTQMVSAPWAGSLCPFERESLLKSLFG